MLYSWDVMCAMHHVKKKITSNGSSSEEVVPLREAVLIGETRLQISVHGKIDSWKGDVSKKTSSCSLYTKKYTIGLYRVLSLFLEKIISLRNPCNFDHHGIQTTKASCIARFCQASSTEIWQNRCQLTMQESNYNVSTLLFLKRSIQEGMTYFKGHNDDASIWWKILTWQGYPFKRLWFMYVSTWRDYVAPASTSRKLLNTVFKSACSPYLVKTSETKFFDSRHRIYFLTWFTRHLQADFHNFDGIREHDLRCPSLNEKQDKPL